MQTGAMVEAKCQSELWERAAMRGPVALPRVRPTADTELEATFLRAAAAWARWEEKRRWASR